MAENWLGQLELRVSLPVVSLSFQGLDFSLAV